MSDPAFRTLHALRIKGFATAHTVSEVADVPVEVCTGHLAELKERELANFVEARNLWRLTPAGKEHHLEVLVADIAATGADEALAVDYHPFMAINERFKELCGEWQLKDGQPNDHTDASYDAAVIAKLVALHNEAEPVVAAMGVAVPRFAPYASRLAQTCQRVVAGETKMFTGVMCGSYHDVWMELHEDLLLTQGINRVEEGSF